MNRTEVVKSEQVMIFLSSWNSFLNSTQETNPEGNEPLASVLHYTSVCIQKVLHTENTEILHCHHEIFWQGYFWINISSLPYANYSFFLVCCPGFSYSSITKEITNYYTGWKTYLVINYCKFLCFFPDIYLRFSLWLLFGERNRIFYSANLNIW